MELLLFLYERFVLCISGKPVWGLNKIIEILRSTEASLPGMQLQPNREINTNCEGGGGEKRIHGRLIVKRIQGD